MNEQFEKLMYHAGLTAQGCWDEMDAYNREAIEKFAKLIVQECANVIQQTNRQHAYTNYDLDMITSTIEKSKRSVLEHFDIQ